MFSNANADAALAALDAAVFTLADLDFDTMDNPQRLEVLRRIEIVARKLPAVGNELLARMGDQRKAEEFGGEHPLRVVADALRITRSAAAKRFHTAEQLATRFSLTGDVLPPELPALAAAVRAGEVGDAHVQLIRTFLHHLPTAVDEGTRGQAQAQLTECATTMRPDELAKVAARLAGYLNPDGSYAEKDRARTRSLRLGKQGPDLMSSLTGRVDPELRTYLEAVFAKLAAPGSCNPDDEAPVMDREPDADSVQRDKRTHGQRCHDGLKAACRALLASGELGQHRGLPVSVVVSTTLRELGELAGPGTTAGGSLLPVRDLVRMAAHARHYLAVFDDTTGRALYLARAKRIATADQRIVLHARDIGCSFPGCGAPGYLAQAHHRREWADGGATDIDNLTLVCHTHHKLAGTGLDQWRTTATWSGRTAWIPPFHVDPRQRQRVNHFHHPGEVLVGVGADSGEPP
ncbi:HNH endonuclease signature motif containing protein [Aldersonia kunmingensis]|uniref:HNH endonuclease signature motif containing protein n=1 Tax=Aldersonia kunmingensis TaxID=408066 RepID=UPI0008353C1B|nr:HNH endonuclease signature motif containing protein [Aldersonia kunmingensis]